VINLKKVIIPILILVAAGAGWYFLKGNGAGPINLGGSVKNEAFKGGLAAAVKLGVPMKCSYSIDGEMESEGYIKGKNYRGKMTAEQGKIAEVIMKDNCMWNWDEDTKEGVKFCFENEEGNTMWGDFDEEDFENVELPEGYEPPDMEYDCKPAIIADSKFIPPSDVEFVDMQEIMNSFMPANTEGVEDFDAGSMNIDDWKQ